MALFVFFDLLSAEKCKVNNVSKGFDVFSNSRSSSPHPEHCIMFFLVAHQTKISLKPRDFGPNMRAKIMHKLRHTVEGKATGKFGYTILVTRMRNLSVGVLHEDTGNAQFTAEYLALVFKPFKGEILPAEVKTVSQQGFFAQAGPLEIFVASQLMPDELKYDLSTGTPSFVAGEDDDELGELRVSAGSMVRIKIIGMRFDSDEIHIIGTIKEDYLGPF